MKLPQLFVLDERMVILISNLLVQLIEGFNVCMYAMVLQNFWGKKPWKKLADLHPRQSNLFQRSNFSGVYKTSLHFTK
jgi:hypothetical protein